MVNYHIHENGWSVILDNFDFKNATKEDADEISYLISKHSMVIATNTDVINALTVEEEKRFCEYIGELDMLDYMKKVRPLYRSAVDQENKHVARVTGEKSKNGMPGLFGVAEVLDWHNNRPQDKGKKTVVYLRTIKGALGSRTSWTNNVLAWKTLQEEDPDFANYLKENKFKIVCGQSHKTNSGYHNIINTQEIFDESTARDIIFTNESNQTSLFVPKLQAHHILGLSVEDSMPIISKLFDYCTQERFVYHHDWADSGEIILSCQWSGMHRREQFDGIETRLLHRICFDYTHTTWFNELPQETKEYFASL